MLEKATDHADWNLGQIKEGQEWFAFTFGSQQEMARTREELAQLLADADQTVQHAYARMQLSEQPWARHVDREVDFITKHVGLQPGVRIADFGCGIGRHLIALGKQGFAGVGIDFVPLLIEQAQARATAAQLGAVVFQVGDCREVLLDTPQDVILCLYDVIGSFPDETENDRLIENIARNVRPGGRVLASVLNLEMTEHRAVRIANVMEHPEALVALPPSRTMQKTGDIFNPNHYLLDPSTSLVYRKEQFDEDYQLPAELIVRDRRYRRAELIQKFAAVGIKEIACTYVQAGRWDQPLEATDTHAKEILFLGEKM